MKLNIIFEDKAILIIDKPPGLVVNRSETIREETLQDQLGDYFNLGNSLGVGDRAGIVHRLDRETSGLLIVAKVQKVFENLQAQFKDHEVKKEYIALVHGHLKKREGTIELSVGRIGKFGKFGISGDQDSRPSFAKASKGKESRTDFRVEKEFVFNDMKLDELLSKTEKTKSRKNYLKVHARNYSLVDLFPRTGRTHQIRVHIKSSGNPAVSDLIYAPKKLLKFDLLWCPRLFLHAASIEFKHPKNKKILKFNSALPKDLKDAIVYLDNIA